MTRTVKKTFSVVQLSVLIVGLFLQFAHPLKLQAHNAGAPNTTTIHYRWRDDTAALNTNSGWLAAQDTSYSGSTATLYRLRLEISNEGTAEAKNISYGLEYATKVGGTCGDDESYGAVSTSEAGIYIDLSGQYTNGDAVTSGFLTGESTTFVNGEGVESPGTATGVHTLQADEYTEVEFALKSTNISATTYCIRLTGVDTTSVEAEITTTPPNSDLSWATGAADFEIWESSSTTWDSGTLICGGTLTDDNAATISCTSGSIAASTQYRVQAVLQNDSVTPATMYASGGSVSHVAVKGGWAGTTPTLGACAFNDLGTDDNGTPVCSVTFSTNDVVITNTGTLANSLVIGASGGQQGFSYLITTDSDTPATDSTSYMDATAYDTDTENSSKITISGPSNAPTGTITSATADTDGTGGVVVVAEIDDPNNDDTKLKLEYDTDATCDGAWNAATITGTATADFNDSGGAPDVNNASAYQIGSTATTRVITSSGSNTITFEWDSASDLASGNQTVCLRLTANDDTEDQVTPDTQTVTIDNVDPTFTGSLTDGGRGYDYITYTYGSSASDTNEPGTDAYNMYYKAGTSGVTTGDTEHDDTDFNAYNYAAGTDTIVSSLTEDAQYVANIWANDTFGNQTAATEINLKTRARPTGSINSVAQKTDATGVVDISVEIDSGDNRDTRIKVEYETNGSACDGPWAAATLTGTATADFNDSGGAPDINNSNAYQVGSTATTRVITSSGSNTITFDWDTQTDLPYASGTHCIRITANDDLFDQATPATQTVTVDNISPSAPGNLTSGGTTGNSVTLTFGSQSSDSAWWNSSWLNRMKLSFDNSSTAPETLTNFPVMVPLTSSNIDFAKVLANGADLRFVDADNSTELDYEIEDWDEAGTSVVWVRVPSIATGNADYIYLYYNNTGASDNQNANGVWSAYDNAYHLNEAPADDTNAFVDSAGNGISGRAYNLSDGDGGSSGATGYLAGGVLFEPTDDFVQFAQTGAYTTSFTASLWTYLNDLDCTNQDDVLMHRDAGGTSRGWKILQECGSLSLYLSPNGSTPYTTRYSTSNLTATTWHNVVAVYDSVNQTIELYIDGDSVGGTYFNDPVPTSIYATAGIASSIAFWGQGNVDGYFDEIRLASGAQSAAWVEAQYKSMSDAFVTFGAEESEPSGNFSTYKIFYKAGTSGVTTSDTEHIDADLGFVDYNSTANTTVSGLLSSTDYVFNIWAYDTYGNNANATEVTITTAASGNNAPTSTPYAIAQKTDGSGDVDVTIEVDDGDDEDVKLKLEYLAGGACTGTWLDPTLTGPATADFNDSGGVPDVNNANTYQVGTTATTRVITSSGSNTVQFDWDSSTDLPSGDGTYCMRVTANDDTEDQTTPNTNTVTIDNVNPSTPGNLTVSSKSTKSVTLAYGSAASDTNEPGTDAYKIFYKQGTSGVATTDTEWDSVDLDSYNYGGNSTITITGLLANTDYVFNIWAYDAYGHEVSATEVTTKTETNAVRVTEYYISSGFTGTEYSLQLDQALEHNHFILIRGSADGGVRHGPDENYVRVSELPSGVNGSITATTSSDRIGLKRNSAAYGWVGVVTVVEALADFTGETFRTVDVLEIPMDQEIENGAEQTGTATSSTPWSDSSRLVPFGGIRGSGIESEAGNADTALDIQDGPSGFLRLYPRAGSDQIIEWGRWNINSRGLEYATATVHLIEFGSNWTVQYVEWDRWLDGTLNGGPDANDVSEYSTKSISSVTRANTWIWNTGQGGGDSGSLSYHGNIVTLGDGVSDSTTESTIAIGQAVAGGTTSFLDTYVMSHGDAAVDYRFTGTSGTTDLTDSVTVDTATDGYRFAWVSSSVESTAVQSPYEMLSARYTANTTVELERLHHNSVPFMGWVQGIDLSGLGYTPGTYQQSGEFTSSAIDTNAYGTISNRRPLAIQWQQSVPSGCQIRVYLRGTNTGPSPDFSSSTWDWSYSSTTATIVSEDISTESGLNDKRFLQYRVYMESCSSGGNTPSLLDLFIDFD